MTRWQDLVGDYLRLRRSFGVRLHRPGQMLAGFARYLEDNDASHLTVEAALAWATQPAGAEPVWHWLRLSAVRGLAGYLHAIDPRHQVPPVGLLRRRYHRRSPYLFTSTDIDALLRAAAALRPSLYAAAVHTLIGLLAITGMRPGEAIRLDRSEVDLTGAVLTIAGSKHGTTRQILLHPSTITALRAYARRRDELCPLPQTPSFLVSSAGIRRLLRQCLERTFTRLLLQAGIQQHAHRPGLKDFRHAFAVTTLIGWYRSGADVTARLPLLSAWLGHRDPASTYWYLSASPELLALAAERMTRTPNPAPDLRKCAVSLSRSNP